MEKNKGNIHVPVTNWDAFIGCDLHRCGKHKTSYVKKENLKPGMGSQEILILAIIYFSIIKFYISGN